MKLEFGNIVFNFNKPGHFLFGVLGIGLLVWGILMLVLTASTEFGAVLVAVGGAFIIALFYMAYENKNHTDYRL